MNPLVGKVLVFVGLVAMIAIRAPHARAARAERVVENRRGALEILLLALMSIAGLLLPIVGTATHLLGFADYRLRLPLFVAGSVALLAGLWLFYRAHGDLGRNWSPTLELHETHALVTSGVYAHVRHPMYSAMFLIGIGQALIFPNWIVGPAALVTFALMFALRLGPEERMMRARFGEAYDRYGSQTKRLIPGLW
jgi:protein-S-isoprenylcysteine O-methyltransferase Ste14